MNLSYLFNHAVVVTIFAGVLSIAYGLFLTSRVLAQPRGNNKMNAIADAISEGAAAFLKRQYQVVAVIGIILFIGLGFLLNWPTAIGFAIGAIASALAGIIGMNVAVKSNIRTAQAATVNLSSAFSLAFKGGA